MAKTVRPEGLQDGGRALWDAITKDHELDAVQLVNLTEACRLKDRLDEMDRVIHGKGVLNLLRFRVQGIDFDDAQATVEVKFDDVISKANATANQMKQMLAALRLPDGETGKRPQQRGGARGAYKTGGGKAGTVSSLERARQAKSS